MGEFMHILIRNDPEITSFITSLRFENGETRTRWVEFVNHENPKR